MATLPMIAEEIVSEVLVVFEFFHFMWALLMKVVCFKTLIYCGQLCNNALNYPNTPLINRPSKEQVTNYGYSTEVHPP
jgi:hypothetical protein